MWWELGPTQSVSAMVCQVLPAGRPGALLGMSEEQFAATGLDPETRAAATEARSAFSLLYLLCYCFRLLRRPSVPMRQAAGEALLHSSGRGVKHSRSVRQPLGRMAQQAISHLDFQCQSSRGTPNAAQGVGDGV